MAADALLKTPLHDWHHTHGGRLVEFGGWSMPVQYSTIVDEHNAVRQRVGLFDISHMGRLDFEGPDVEKWLDFVTTNHVAKLAPGQIQYSLMVDDHGGVLDDILVYRRDDGLAVVCNASNRLKVIGQLERHRDGFDARLIDRTRDTAMIAVQGPAALATASRHFDAPLTDLGYYRCASGKILGVDAVASRTGYTGEDGFELIVPGAKAEAVWDALMDAGRVFGIQPCGLGARDTLRFEAAMPLYGHEMDETVNPYAAGLGWAVKLAKGEFVGRDALRKHKAGPGRSRVGLALEGKRIARQGSVVLRDGQAVGVVTSGTFAPTVGQSLAMALVRPEALADGVTLSVDVRGRDEPARIVPLPFYRRAASGA
ncbi:glycine cleavage system aminomethyltransferase GcvT [Tundrisphaera sp. TA3]|uniref:glycine cleavage system aminomethyltransferase GcvT n=1 Tax=Tundrisphaera sp. TA3 TaxID=3435775 RepID=UPI003EC14288